VAERIKFYTDEHVAKAVVAGLRRRGVDVFTAPEAGLHPAADEQHLALAIEQRRVVFTQDADFLRMHAAGVYHYGLVYAPQHTPVGQILRGLMLIYEVLSPEDMLNHVEFL
jgi:hypothetical protein